MVRLAKLGHEEDKTIMADEEERIAIGYIAGTIRVDLTPPNGFNLAPKVDVDYLPAEVKKESIEVKPQWKYLAIVEKGERIVKLTLGNVMKERTIVAKPGQTVRLNFVLSESA